MNKLATAPVKHVALSQALFAATRTRSLMRLQFGLAIATDNHFSSKWLNILLSRLGFVASYDEIRVVDFLSNVHFRFLITCIVFLRSALETVYVPAMLGHMFTGRAFFLAAQSPLLCAAATLSLMLEEFWSELTFGEQSALEKLYDSDISSDHNDDSIGHKIIDR